MLKLILNREEHNETLDLFLQVRYFTLYVTRYPIRCYACATFSISERLFAYDHISLPDSKCSSHCMS